MTNTIKYMDAISLLHSSGHAGLTSSAISHYDRMTGGMDAEHRCRVSAMFDEVLGLALERRDEITAEDILISPDFAAIRALARVLQDLGLVPMTIQLNELDVVQNDFMETIKPPPPPVDHVFDDVEIEPIELEPLEIQSFNKQQSVRHQEVAPSRS